MSQAKQRVAVVLFNLGGPDSQEAVRPFLFNLFNDPAIIGAPGPVRWALAQFISRTRAPQSRKVYGEMGGSSPLLGWTEKQATALEGDLAARLAGDVEARAFIAMRYWKPFTKDAVEAVKAFGPDEIVLLPLYPQFSTTTTGSSLREWDMAARRAGLDVPTRTVCCYPENDHLVEAHAQLLATTLRDAAGPSRILFSAHGLPERVIEAGDPYQSQVEATAARVVERLAHLDCGAHAYDWVVCYQSRVGPLKWIGPSTDDEIARAAADQQAIVLTPIAFVSEHVETLVELDIEYREVAEELNAISYRRVPALGLQPDFIAALASAVEGALKQACAGVSRADGGRCAAAWGECPRRALTEHSVSSETEKSSVAVDRLPDVAAAVSSKAG
ncbi:MAG: ferrochelatase [Pseudomonadota bacterium]